MGAWLIVIAAVADVCFTVNRFRLMQAYLLSLVVTHLKFRLKDVQMRLCRNKWEGKKGVIKLAFLCILVCD
jgi:hypothetical protein